MNVKGDSTISLYSGVPKNFPSKRLPKKKKSQHAQHIQKLSNRERQNQREKKKEKKKEKRKKPANKNNL